MPISRSTISPRIMCWRSMWPCEALAKNAPSISAFRSPASFSAVSTAVRDRVFMSVSSIAPNASSSADHIDIVHRVLLAAGPPRLRLLVLSSAARAGTCPVCSPRPGTRSAGRDAHRRKPMAAPHGDGARRRYRPTSRNNPRARKCGSAAHFVQRIHAPHGMRRIEPVRPVGARARRQHRGNLAPQRVTARDPLAAIESGGIMHSRQFAQRPPEPVFMRDRQRQQTASAHLKTPRRARPRCRQAARRSFRPEHDRHPRNRPSVIETSKYFPLPVRFPLQQRRQRSTTANMPEDRAPTAMPPDPPPSLLGMTYRNPSSA